MNKKSHQYIILTPKYCWKDQRSCDGRGGGQGTSYFRASVAQWKKKALDVGGPSSSLKGSILFLESPSRGRPEFYTFYLFLGVEKEAAKLRWRGRVCVWRVNAPKKMGARSARARTRGQNPLVIHTSQRDCQQ